MTGLKIGDKAPKFSLPAGQGKTISLKDFAGQNLILYFYPKDDTPGCTTQACGFRDNLPHFEGMDAAILGVSKDSVAKHEKFIAKHDLNFPLLSDEDGSMCEDYGVWVEKNMYGKKYMGIERTSFLIDENGVIVHIWSKVKVPGHVEAVREILEGQQKAA